MKPKIKESKVTYSGFFEIREDLLERHDGRTQNYTSLILTHAVAILAKDETGRWILNREYRHAAGEYLLGCPGGRIEEGEDPLFAAQRELLEETGYLANTLEVLGCCYPFPGLSNQKITYLFAKNATKQGAQNLDPFEFIETELKTEEELKEAIRTGTNVDAVLCTALWYFMVSRVAHS